MNKVAVYFGVYALVNLLAWQEGGPSRLAYEHSTGHLSDDQLNMFVVNRDALFAVYLLNLFDKVLLGLAHSSYVKKFLGIAWAIN